MNLIARPDFPSSSIKNPRRRMAGIFCVLVLLLGQPVGRAVNFSVTPAFVATDYTGPVRLQITGLTNGETIRVSKYLDLNTNGTISAIDPLVQTFTLTDGQANVIGAATNINVPGDFNPTNGAITASLGFLSGGFDQHIVGRYLYRVSSPNGRFASITNRFTITNAPQAQGFTGKVRCSGTNVPYAVAMLFTPPSSHGGMSPVGGAVANSTGTYSLQAPPGTYMLWAFKSNFIADLEAAPVLTLGAGATITTNLNLLPVTRLISGRVIDAVDTNTPLAGISIVWISTNNLAAPTFTGLNGYFNAGVTAGEWKLEGDQQVLSFLGYVGVRQQSRVSTTVGNVTGLTLAFPRSTALIYGSVRDEQDRPLAGIRLRAEQDDGQGPYSAEAISDQDGNYALGINTGTWSAQVDNGGQGSADYIFPQGLNSTSISDGEAVPVNFTGIRATNHISGYVTAAGSAPVASVGVNVAGNLNGSFYNAYADTDANGFYTFNVPNGVWDVNVNCGGGNDSLSALGYLCVDSQMVTVSNSSTNVNFSVLPAPSQIVGQVQDTSGTPIPNAGVYARMTSGATNWFANASTDSTGHYVLYVANGSWSVGLDCSGGNNGLSQLGYLCVGEQTVAVTNSVGTANFVTMPAVFHLTGRVTDTINHPVADVGVYANATIVGSAYADFVKTDGNGYYSMPVADGTWTVGVECFGLGALGYDCPPQQTSTISGADATLNFTVLTTNPSPPVTLLGPARLLDGSFQFSFNTVAGVSYTVQYSGNLANWQPMLTFIGTGAPRVFNDPTAPGANQRFYRVKVGP